MRKNKEHTISNSTDFTLRHGDLARIAKISGRSYSSVQKTISLGIRNDQRVLDAARKVSDFNKEFNL